MPRRTEAERFWEKVRKNGPLIAVRPELGPCWLWTAGKFSDGYGAFGLTVVNGSKQKLVKAHNWALSEAGILVPSGFTPDHLCHTLNPDCNLSAKCPHRACVNVAHIEVVTTLENIRRGRGNGQAQKTHCSNGHPYNKENTYNRPDGGRNCRVCDRESKRVPMVT